MGQRRSHLHGRVLRHSCRLRLNTRPSIPTFERQKPSKVNSLLCHHAERIGGQRKERTLSRKRQNYAQAGGAEQRSAIPYPKDEGPTKWDAPTRLTKRFKHSFPLP